MCVCVCVCVCVCMCVQNYSYRTLYAITMCLAGVVLGEWSSVIHGEDLGSFIVNHATGNIAALSRPHMPGLCVPQKKKDICFCRVM